MKKISIRAIEREEQIVSDSKYEGVAIYSDIKGENIEFENCSIRGEQVRVEGKNLSFFSCNFNTGWNKFSVEKTQLTNCRLYGKTMLGQEGPEIKNCKVMVDKTWHYQGKKRERESKFLLENYHHQETGLEFAALPGGRFFMGSEKGNNDEKPVHEVELDSFLMSKTVVTQGMWKKIMGSEPWKGKDYVKESDNCPAVYVSWNDTQEFCRKTGLRLPTEAEWEYGCRGGTRTEYYWGDKIDGDYCWYDGNARVIGEDYAHAVGQKKANSFGLYDMSGNVWEFCADWYDDNYYQKSPAKNPQGPENASVRVRRGGLFGIYADGCRSSSRGCGYPDHAAYNIGFRLVAPSF